MTHRLRADRVCVEIDAAAGGRLASLVVDGLELLVARDGDALGWGCYPMAPFAGRVRNGRFRFAGQEHALPITAPPHAIHGTTWTRPWQVEHVSDTEIRLGIALGESWPWPGSARQGIAIDPEGMRLTLGIHSEGAPFPASLGWHPWFRRRLARGGDARLDFAPTAMYRRDRAGIPDGVRIPPPPGPWDDCFTGLVRPPVLRWPGALALVLESSVDHWVVYDRPAHALCVEPQTGPPDALTLAPRIVTPDAPLEATLQLRWQREPDAAEDA